MNARMEKYEEKEIKQRTKRNEKLYSKVQDINIDYVDIDVNNAVELSSYDNAKTSREDYHKQKELDKIMPKKQEQAKPKQDIIPKEDRVYDIEEILKMARENKLFSENEKKRLINTEYNILTKLDIQSIENDSMKKEDIKTLINNIYENEKPKKKQGSSEGNLLSDLLEDTGEVNLENETNEVSSSKNLETSNEKTKEEIVLNESMEEEKPVSSKENDLEEKMDDFIEIKEGNGLLIVIIIVVILISLTCCFLVYEYFFGL